MISQITSKVFIGDIYDAVNREALKNFKITVMLSVNCRDSIEEIRLCKEMNIQYIFHKFIIEGEKPLKYQKRFVKVSKDLAKLVENGETVFVHCGAGQERSPLVVALYLSHSMKISLFDAYDFIKEKRPEILRRYEWVPKNELGI